LESGYSKLPVYRQTIDDIVGLVFLHDIFSAPGKLQEMLRPAHFVPETLSGEALLTAFQARSESMAIVMDEYGGTAGLVTVEDLTEELFGEFSDAFEQTGPAIAKLDQGWLVKGEAEIDQLNEELGLDLPRGDYETIAGWMAETLGRLPEKNAEAHTPGHRYVVSATRGPKVEKVFIQEKADATDEMDA
jgi:CBS domain containing-hemolysin-like protein